MRPHLTTLNCGLGRDSIAMLCLLAERQLMVDGEHVGPEAVDAVLFADTGAEWPHTYALLPRVAAWCAGLGLPFYHLAKPSEAAIAADERPKGSRDAPHWMTATTIEERCATGYYHRRPGIVREYMRRATIAVRSAANCTDNHKIQPMRRLLGDLCEARFGVDLSGWGRLVRRGLALPHVRLIGFTMDELERAAPHKGPSYERLAFPLIEARLTKADEGRILRRHGFDDIDAPVLKSGCYVCPWQSAGWFWALSVQHPELYAVAVAYEAAALARHPKMFVCGGDPQLALPEKVVWWRANNPGAQVEQVLRKDYHRGCRAVNPAQGVLIESTAAPERHHLVQRLFGALSSGEADPEMYRQLQGALERAGLRAAAEQARDAHALAKIAERRPAPAPVASAEHLQLFEEVA